MRLMEAPAEVHVRMGQLAMGHGPTVLKATLGSCVGIAFIWHARDRSALAHCLLPYAPCAQDAPVARPPSGARYVDQAIAALLHLLRAQPEDFAQIEVHLAGGANMSRRAVGDSRTPMVGALNIEAALQLLSARGLAVCSQDLGGTVARQMRLDCATGGVSVTRVPAP
jgi:chemotaxis protein CheD